MKCPHCKGTGEMSATFGALVKHHRQAAGLSQAEVAATAGVTRAHIANIETDRSDAPLTTIIRIADAIGVTTKTLIPERNAEKEGA